jgi:hypothetical protein
MNYLRYVAARWGHSPAVFAWELFSELEWTDEYRLSIGMGRDQAAPQIENWHSEMAAWLRACDHNRHPIATHFSHPIRGAGVFSVPEVEIATSNAYSAFDEIAGNTLDASVALQSFWSGSAFGHAAWRGFRTYRKPALVLEQGRHWMGVDIRWGRKRAHNTRPQLDADLHAGLWGSLMQPLGGATGYWWWFHVFFDQRQGEYRALANFLEGEDLRAAPGEPLLEPSTVDVENDRDELRCRLRASDRRAYLWVYHREVVHELTGLPAVRNAAVSIRGLRAGQYSIEFWDTHSGARIGAANGAVAADAGGPGSLRISLPVVQGDLALKVKPAAR